MDTFHKDPDWRVFLIGGHSATGKTVASKRLGLRLGVPWMMVDDLRLAFQRARARLPTGTEALYFDTVPDYWSRRPEEQCEALIGVGEALLAPLEVVIENHVDQSAPIIIEGDGILPSLLSRPPVTERAASMRAVFLVEPDESEILATMLERGRGVVSQTQRELRNGARQVAVRAVAHPRGGAVQSAGNGAAPLGNACRPAHPPPCLMSEPEP